MVVVKLFVSVLLGVLLAAAASAENPQGTWSGALKTPNGSLRLQVNIKQDAQGQYSGTIDSPDQGARGIPIRTVALVEEMLVLDVARIGGRYEAEWNAGKLQWEGEWTQGATSLPLILARGELPKPPRPQTPLQPYPYREEEVSYRNPASGLKLAGTLTLPKGDGPFTAALLITGSGQQDRDETVSDHKPFWIVADYLTRQGIAVLRVDDRGVGGSQAGNLKSATSADFATDVDAGIAYLQTRADIAAKKIGLIGHSEGGMIASMVAARKSSPVAWMVLLAAPGVSGGEVLRMQGQAIGKAMGQTPEQLERLAELNSEIGEVVKSEPDAKARRDKLRPLMSTFIRTSGMPDSVTESQLELNASEWFRYFLMYDPAVALKQVRCPVLALNGEKDLQMSARENLAGIRQALTSSPNKPEVQVRELPGLNHLFQSAVTGTPAEYARISETFSPDALKEISDWIAHLR